MIFIRFLQITALVVCLPLVAWAQDVIRPQPEISTGTGAVSTATGEKFMIVTANPHATQAGYKILKRGGSAVDAAIVAQLVLGLTEPQSSGLGGGAFMLHYNAKDQKLTSYDGRETAPNLATSYMFQQNGAPMAFMDAVVGGRAVGVPGTPALLKETHEIHGKLTWMELFEDAIKLAEGGFEVSPRLAKMIDEAKDRLVKDKNAALYFLPAGQPIKAGEVIKNPEYAETLKDFAFYGPSKFYRGKVARNIVQTVQNIEENPGLLTTQDFENYEIKQRDPVCGPYRSYIVCSMGQPSSGALTMLATLGMLEGFEITNDTRGWSIIAQASQLAFADRNKYMADPDFVNTPDIALIDPKYLKPRADLIDPDKPLEKIEAGTPPNWQGPLYEEGNDIAKPGTSHISIIDSYGNIVAMTTTIEGAFGSHVMVDGFLLNNQLTDFAFTPIDDEQALIANMAQGGKRPRSSMSPTIVFDQAGQPVLIIGSAGGSRIIGYVLQRIIAAIDWGVDISDAMAMPHTLARGKAIETENETLQAPLETQGHVVDLKTLNSGLTAIQFKDDSIIGAADPRREGLALGE